MGVVSWVAGDAEAAGKGAATDLLVIVSDDRAGLGREWRLAAGRGGARVCEFSHQSTLLQRYLPHNTHNMQNPNAQGTQTCACACTVLLCTYILYSTCKNLSLLRNDGSSSAASASSSVSVVGGSPNTSRRK